MVNANNQEGYSSDTTTPGLNDGEKIPKRTETPKKIIFKTRYFYHVFSILRVQCTIFFFLYLVPSSEETSLLTTFYGLYFSHHYTYYKLQIMLDLLCGQLYILIVRFSQSLSSSTARGMYNKPPKGPSVLQFEL